MRGVLRYALRAFVLAGLVLAMGPASAGHVGAIASQADRLGIAASSTDRVLRVADQKAPQTAKLPRGTVMLSIIPRLGAQAMRLPITWRVMSYGRDDTGNRRLVTEVTEATPRLDLPAGWYVVHAMLPDRVIKHPVEVTAGRTFKYTLVKN